ncbi:ATP-binding protein [Vibrio parahaemolyticus]|nr:ATP-binding protein [Vibrio parahaemolyticus]AWJ80145.1 ATP-binding protein [Vibrio parahaemolyticus]MBE3700102.1 ATP-binding protein [Vibrio parahaemolyticus]MBE3779847.1 ATP-binding protein [Vibrio parahaemolyticus]MBM5034646.1 ATP-binding protein [Vibrio parahaemolyticus]
MAEEINKIVASPAKRFFVDMLTRDIELLDAILDLIDNSLDGAMRESKKQGLPEESKYQGFETTISFDRSHFQISDNCGGIPKDVAINSAFRMGRPANENDSDLPTVGVYGIGMKRAIFKMGKCSKVESKTEEFSFSVDITPEWMEEDGNWDLPYEISENEDLFTGTTIRVENLRNGIIKTFEEDTEFANDLISAAEIYYSAFIEKGFKIVINNKVIEPSVNLLAIEDNFDEKAHAISPFVFRDKVDDVEISVVVGFYRNFVTGSEEADALEGKENTKASSSKAGVTVLCNDRVVIHADKTRMTGWGEAGVPSYHTQFISIAGVVKFRCNDPSKLPLTTTKRGIEGNSELYLKVKEHIREGLKIFTNFTNKWKNREDRAQLSIQNPKRNEFVKVSEVVNKIPDEKWSNLRGKGNENAQRFVPKLPLPPKDSQNARISFSKPLEEIKLLSEFYFDDETKSPKEVGEKCFDDALKRAE